MTILVFAGGRTDETMLGAGFRGPAGLQLAETGDSQD